MVLEDVYPKYASKQVKIQWGGVMGSKFACIGTVIGKTSNCITVEVTWASYDADKVIVINPLRIVDIYDTKSEFVSADSFWEGVSGD